MYTLVMPETQPVISSANVKNYTTTTITAPQMSNITQPADLVSKRNSSFGEQL